MKFKNYHRIEKYQNLFPSMVVMIIFLPFKIKLLINVLSSPQDFVFSFRYPKKTNIKKLIEFSVLPSPVHGCIIFY